MDGLEVVEGIEGVKPGLAGLPSPGRTTKVRPPGSARA
jgi:hypothetical protein